MESTWLEIAYINLDEAILHGRVAGKMDRYGVVSERDVRQTLTDEQKNAVVDMNERHRDEMRALLKSFIA